MDNTAQSPEQAATQRFCFQCGKALDPGAAFCGGCGASVQGGASSGPPLPSTAAPAASAPRQDWKKYAGVLAMGVAALWKYKFTLFILLRSISLFGRHVR
jgi:hypothetical protein